jgi:hypothetical protein
VNSQRRPPLYLLTGLVLGLIFGLVYSLALNPVHFASTAPRSLGEEYKDQYRVMIARAYVADGDIERASARLNLLNDSNTISTLALQAQRLLTSGIDNADAHALALLVEALQRTAPTAIPQTTSVQTQVPTQISMVDDPSATVSPLPTSTVDTALAVSTATLEPSPSSQPDSTSTPRFTAIPEGVLLAVFTLDNQQEMCNVSMGDIPLEIEVFDENQNPLPGIPIQVSWDGGEDTFYTGLYPERGLGYADFNMLSGKAYSIRVGERGQLVNGVKAVLCTAGDGSSFDGGWQLTFVAP